MKPIEIDDFCRLKFVSGIEYSPSGKKAALVLTEIDKKKDDYFSYIYLYENKKFKKLTSFGKERSFQFLDDATVLFPGKREAASGDSQGGAEISLESKYYSISLSGGEAEVCYTFPIPVSKISPLKNGNLLVEAAVFPGFEDLYKGDPKYLAAYQAHLKENADYEIIEQNPWWHNGGTFTKGAYSGLFLWDTKKKKLTWLSKKNQSVMDSHLSNDEKTVYFISNPIKPKLSLTGESSLIKMNLSTGRQTALLEDKEDFSIRGFDLADDFMVIAAADGKHGLNTDADFYKLDYKTGKLSLYALYGEAIGSSVGSDIRYGGSRPLRVVGNTVYFVSTRFDSANIYKLEDGAICKVTNTLGSVDGFAVSESQGKALAACLHDMQAMEVYEVDLGKEVQEEKEDFSNLKAVSKFNASLLKNKYIAYPEILNVKRKGYDVHGFVLKPIDYNPKKKYPVILDIHGGPKTVYGPVFYHEMQFWASKGYFVIFCNPTGSDGRGSFMDIRGKYGAIDFDDIMAFLDKALKTYPNMDKNNLFETGGSYGGFMTNWIIGHTDRFKACASQRSISNWFSMYGVSDIGVDFTIDQCQSSPWDNPEKLWSHSPMKYANKVKTPTLFIHSFEDYRCPIDQGYQMFTSLIAHGVETRMVAFKGENHELSRSGKPSHRLKRLTEITNWFEKYRK